MIKTKYSGIVTLQDGYEGNVICDHCFRKVTRFYIAMETGYGAMYQPQLCGQCWIEFMNRIHQLVTFEEKLNEIFKLIMKSYNTPEEKLRQIEKIFEGINLEAYNADNNKKE